MPEEKKGHGGARQGAGRKPIRDEQKLNALFVDAIKLIYKKDDEEEAKIALITVLAKSQRGQIFIAEHLFGKPKDIVETSVAFEKPMRRAFLDFNEQDEQHID